MGDVLVDQLVEKVVARVLDVLGESDGGGRWLCGAKAIGQYLGCSPRRVYARAHVLPLVRDDGRIMAHTADLDRHLRSS